MYDNHSWYIGISLLFNKFMHLNRSKQIQIILFGWYGLRAALIWDMVIAAQLIVIRCSSVMGWQGWWQWQRSKWCSVMRSGVRAATLDEQNCASCEPWEKNRRKNCPTTSTTSEWVKSCQPFYRGLVIWSESFHQQCTARNQSYFGFVIKMVLRDKIPLIEGSTQLAL